MLSVRAHKARIRAGERKLQIARANAIQRYAELEQGLCELFAYLSDTDPIVAGTIFFRISNARARSGILEKLMKKKHGATYRDFFKSFVKGLAPINDARNEIIHWHMVGLGKPDEKGSPIFTEMVLTPPNIWMYDGATSSHNTQSLDNMASKFSFYCEVTRLFVNMLNRRQVIGLVSPSPDIFHTALDYPLPERHPLAQFLKPQKRRAPPQS